MKNPPCITSFLIKIASRCNLACDYCYMYRHADQSWQSQPFLMSANHRKKLSIRLAEYVKFQQLNEILVIFHGGEPLLSGIETIIETKKWIRDSVPLFCKVDFSLQTNGLLLTDEVLCQLQLHNIGVSLSIDGPREAHDRHRVDHKGRSSFETVEKSLKVLMNYPSIYSGLIAVIDPLVSPKTLFEFFDTYNPPQLDFLLPDANYNQQPPGRDIEPNIYSTWLVEAFDIWFDKYPHIVVRTFDSILKSIVGLPSNTDSFGFGDISLLTIETDGSYHDLDVLKITADGHTSLGKSLDKFDIETVVSSSLQIEDHRRYLTFEGLSTECQNCSIVDICGGGSIPHRYAEDGFNHPTIYCHEMMVLISHARKRLEHQLDCENANRNAGLNTVNQAAQVISKKITEFEQPETSTPLIELIFDKWVHQAKDNLIFALDWSQCEGCEPEILNKIRDGLVDSPKLSIYPSVILWVSSVLNTVSGIKSYSIDGNELSVDPMYPKHILGLKSNFNKSLCQGHLVHRNDIYLRIPFGKNIVFEDDSLARQGRKLLQESLLIIEAWRPSLLEEMRLISPEIQFIKDLTADPDKIVSFSDNAVPGALYVSIRQGENMVSAYDLADSLIHEHRHQKLYLLQQILPLVSMDSPYVVSPWRDDLRPPSGLFHAVFVFTHLLEFWEAIFQDERLRSDSISKNKAREQVDIIQTRLSKAFFTLKETNLTEAGVNLIEQLEIKSLAIQLS